MDSYKKSRRKSIIAWVIAFVLAIGAAIVSFTPFIFMVLNSFKEKFEMLTKGVFQLPDQLNWSNYTEVLTGGFANYFKNSVIVLAISLILHIADLIEAELARQNSHIELIASENWVSKAVMAAMGSPLTNKYAEGYPGKRYYGGCQCCLLYTSPSPRDTR